MNFSKAKRLVIVCCLLLNALRNVAGAEVGAGSGNRTRPAVDICDRQPTINGLCGSSTLGIYYDAETKRCKYLGCSPGKKIFSSLEDCEKICNRKNRRRHRRVRYSKP